MSDALLNITQLAGRLNLRERRIMTLVRQGQIPYVKIGRQVFFHADEIEDWLQANAHPATITVTRPVTKGIPVEPKAPDGAPIRLVRGLKGRNREWLKNS